MHINTVSNQIVDQIINHTKINKHGHAQDLKTKLMLMKGILKGISDYKRNQYISEKYFPRNFKYSTLILCYIQSSYSHPTIILLLSFI